MEVQFIKLNYKYFPSIFFFFFKNTFNIQKKNLYYLWLFKNKNEDL